jgi:DNA-binding NarL/FixJ family response regulator
MRGPSVETLSRRENQIVDAILAGCTNKEIAHRLGVSDQTVKNQLSALYRKLGVSSRLELALMAMHLRDKPNRSEE